MADVGDVADGRRPLGETGDGGERHDGVADVVHVDVDAVQRAAVDGDAASRRASTRQPIRSSTSTKRTSPCRLSLVRSWTVTAPPVMAAAAKK